MADLKISQLPAATTPLAGTEVLPIVQSGTTKQATIINVLASTASLGANTFTAAQEWATGTAIASAATINLNTATGNRVHITGTTTITAVTLTRGPRTVIFDGALTLTHNATTNNLPGAVNITTAAGDRAIYESDGTTVYCVSYIKASGLAVLNPVATSTTSGLVPTPPNDASKVLSGAMTYVTPALTLLSTVTASNSATVDIETTFNSTYDVYIIQATGVTVGTGNSGINCRFKIGGSYIGSGTPYSYAADHTGQADTSYQINRSTAADQIEVVTVGDTGGGSTQYTSFEMRIDQVASTALYKTATWVGMSLDTGDVYLNQRGGGRITNAGALTGVRFLASSGNIAAGTFRLYGIANS